MEAMYLRAWIDGLHRINNAPAERPAEPRSPYVRLEDTGRPPYALLRAPGAAR
jgi:hypothetical protein